MSRLTCLLFAVAYVGAGAAPLKFSSGENRTHLLELYSSEGSSPPAEKWLDELTSLQATGGWLNGAARRGRQQEEFAAQAPSRDVNY